MATVTEIAPAKVNLILRVGPPEPSGLHPICSLFARLGLADEVRVSEAEADEVVCEGVTGPNLASRAVVAFREAAGGPGAVPPVRVEITKRIPVAAGLGGGSADAAATLRAAARLTGVDLGEAALRALALGLGSDVPSQLAPAHAIVGGLGDRIEPVPLATMGVVLIPDPNGLSTAAVYRELDRLRAVPPGVAAAPLDPAPPGVAAAPLDPTPPGVATAPLDPTPPGAAKAPLDPEPAVVAAAPLDPTPLREAAALTPPGLAARLANDLQPAALALRPDLAERLRALSEAGALGAAISGSGPTAFGLFATAADAEQAARAIPGAIATEIA